LRIHKTADRNIIHNSILDLSGINDFESFQTPIVQHGGRERWNLGEESFGWEQG
jgi:hypothetical protein